MRATDREMIRDTLRSLFTDHWPVDQAVARSLQSDAVRAIWAELSQQGFDRVGLSDELGLAVTILLVTEAGRAGCPAPVVPVVVANLIRRMSGECGFEGVPALALDAVDMTMGGGSLSGTASFVADTAVADLILVRVDHGIAFVDAKDPGVEIRLTPGLSVPPLASICFDRVACRSITVDGEIVRDMALIERLLLAARAFGAARRGFELVLSYVQQRVQFGQPLAKFQSMQHKLAEMALVLDAGELMIEEAASRYDSGNENWRFLADTAIAYIAGNLRDVSLQTHHAFGAIGFAEEHEAPRHFRRVHADLTRMGGQRRARAAVADFLLNGPAAMPPHDLGHDIERFRHELRTWIDANWTTEDRIAQRKLPFEHRSRSTTFERKLGTAGWLSLAWPAESGGQGASPLRQLVLTEELALADVPTSGISASAWLIGPEIIRHGSTWLKEAMLPAIRSGDYRFALGYSEPEAGSDLTALKTRAVRDGDDYIVTGQKLWGTGTEHATHIALAVRTDPEAASKAAGISVLIVPTDLPGITIQPSFALYGHTFCTQFFDEVRVPATFLLGEENKGWSVLTGALAAERILMGGQIVRMQRTFEHFCVCVATRPELVEDSLVRDTIGKFGAEIEAARQLSLRSVRVLEEGRLPLVEGAFTKVFSGDLAERFSEAALDILGMAATLSEDSEDAPLEGRIEQMLRQSIMLVIGGGASEIQKAIIAQKGLGLPR